MRAPMRAYLLLSMLVVSACGGNVEALDETDDAGDSKGGAAGAPGGTGGTEAGVGGNTGVGGAPSVDGGPQPALCDRTHEEFAYSAMLNTGQYMGCGDAGSGLYDVDNEGTVMGVTTEGEWQVLVVNGSEVRIKAPGLALDIPVGTYVRMMFAADEFEGRCVERLLITSPQYGVLFAASNGTHEPAPGSPFGVVKEPLDCPTEPSGSCGPDKAGNYALQFHPAGEPSASQSVRTYMGQPPSYFSFTHDGIVETLLVRNLRSYVTGECGERFDWAWWAVRAWPE